MPSGRTLLAALVGIALPIGLALAVYLSSPGTIAANPVSLPASALAQGSSGALDEAKPNKANGEDRKHRRPRGATTSGSTTSSGTTTSDDHGGSSGTSDDHSGSGSSGSGSDGSSGSGSSGSGGSDDSGGDD